jgi:hypothetical protein
MKSQSPATTNDRLVAEFFAIKSGWIQEIHAVLVNRPDDKPTGWPPEYGPSRGGDRFFIFFRVTRLEVSDRFSRNNGEDPRSTGKNIGDWI